MITTLLAALLAASASAPAPRLTVTAVNPLPVARERETLELTRSQLAPLGESDLWKIHVRDASGRELIVQAVDTDFDELHTPDIVIFQSDFGPGERRSFSVTAGARQKYTPADYKAYGRFVRERFDDFAWENDRIAHRTYGQALEGWKGEPLTSNSIDIWSKLGPRLIINEWYMMGDAYYHDMSPNGGDFYSAGPTRGDGASGLWAADRLWVARNFVASRQLANGPIRVLFELDYPPFDVNGRKLTQTVRVALDAGSQLDHYLVSLRPEDGSGALTAAVGLKKVAGEEKWLDPAVGTIVTWQPVERHYGMQGLAAIVDPGAWAGPAEDARNNLVRVNVAAGNVLDYWAGFAWDRAGRITSPAAWRAYVERFAKRLRASIQLSVRAE